MDTKTEQTTNPYERFLYSLVMHQHDYDIAAKDRKYEAIFIEHQALKQQLALYENYITELLAQANSKNEHIREKNRKVRSGNKQAVGKVQGAS